MLARLLRALQFAAEQHASQRRKGAGDEPYVNHLIEVAALLAGPAGVHDVDVLVAAVLHDVVEDTPTTLGEVESIFGKRVRDTVASLSDDKTLPKAARKAAVIEHMRHADEPTKLIKLADLCSNVGSIPVGWTVERKREYLDWIQKVALLCSGINNALDRIYQERRAQAEVRLAREAEA